MRQLRTRKNIIPFLASISRSQKRSKGHEKHSNKSLVEVAGKKWATVAVWTSVLVFTLPVFRCGGRTGLTFWDWIREHSVFGSPIQYVPEERYMEELEGAWIDENGNLRW